MKRKASDLSFEDSSSADERDVVSNTRVSDDAIDEIDPLDAFMSNLNDVLEKQDTKTVAAHEIDSESEYSDIPGSSDESSSSSVTSRDPLTTSRRPGSIKTIRPVDFSDVLLQPFSKSLYVEHEAITSLTDEEASNLRQDYALSVTGRNPPRCICSFGHLSLPDSITTVFASSGFTKPTPIQSQAIPAALSGRDVIGIAETGSGKTLAFLIPALMHILANQRSSTPRVLVLCPTRELAVQIEREACKYSKTTGVKALALAGGLNKHEQFKLAFRGACELLVGNPGRVLDLLEKIRKKNVQWFFNCSMLILDEADRMFQLGFGEQISSIIGQMRPDRQTLFFSATMPPRVEQLARESLNEPLRVLVGDLGQLATSVEVRKITLQSDAKYAWLVEALRPGGCVPPGRVLVFLNSRQAVDALAHRLSLDNPRDGVVSIHGDMEQFERLRNLQAFTSGKVHVLVASDVAARGLDIPQVEAVVEYEVSTSKETRTHRAGRTGRAGRSGVAFQLEVEK